MRRSPVPHTLYVHPVWVPGVGKRYALVEPDGKRMAKLYKTLRAALAGRYWFEINSIVH